MGNEQIQSYDVPSVEGVTQDEAVAALDKIDADWVADPKHPYCNSAHPQSKSFKDAVKKLYQIKAGELDAPPERLPSELAETPEEWVKLRSAEGFKPAQVKAMSDSMDEKAGRNEAVQEKLRKDIRREVELINEIVPGDIDTEEIGEPTPEKLEGYQQLRLLRQGNYTALSPLVVKDARGLGMKPDKVEQIKYFLTTAEPGDPLSEDICNIIIRHIHRAKKMGANR